MDRYNSVKKASIVGIISNIFLCFIKGIIALFTNSMAMFAEAFNSICDLSTTFIIYIGNKISNKSKDEKHNYGYGKAEYIYSMIISVMIIISTFVIIKNSVIALIKNNKYNFSIYLIIICIISIIIKAFLFAYINKLSKKYNNLMLKANAIEYRNDCIMTTINLISCILSMYNIYFIDSLVGILIALFTCFSSYKIFRESYDILLDKSLSKDTKNSVMKIISKYSDIQKIIHFNSCFIGHKYQISFTICLDGNMTTYESHNIADSLEKEIDEKIDEIYLTILHVNPVKIEDKSK